MTIPVCDANTTIKSFISVELGFADSGSVHVCMNGDGAVSGSKGGSVKKTNIFNVIETFEK